MRHITIMMLSLLGAATAFASQSSQPEQEPAQDPSAAIRKIDASLDNALKNVRPPTGEPGRPILPEGVSLNDLDPATKAGYLESLHEYFQYRISGYQHRKKVFMWQLYSSMVIFVVVVALVFTAIYFSWLQFRQSLEPRRARGTASADRYAAETAEGADPPAAREPEVTQVEASLHGIRVSSPVLGVVILVISLLFFYLYLVHVYPIQEIF